MESVRVERSYDRHAYLGIMAKGKILSATKGDDVAIFLKISGLERSVQELT